MKIAGVLVGFVGVVLIGRPSGAELAGSNLEGVFYMVAGSLSIGASFVYAKKFIIPLKIPAVALATYQLGSGLMVLALVTDYRGIGHIFSSAHAAIGLIIGLGLLGTGLAYIIYYYIVEKTWRDIRLFRQLYPAGCRPGYRGADCGGADRAGRLRRRHPHHYRGHPLETQMKY